MTRSLSLRARLTLIILVPLLVISLAVAVWAARDAQARAADRFDRSLLVTALGISRDTAFSGGNALSRDARDLLRNTSGEPVFYHVYAPDGVFVTGYATPPVPPLDLPEAAYSYYDAIYQGQPVRAVRFTDQMTIDDLTGGFTFTVWQSLSLRDGFVRSLLARTYGVLGTVVLAVGFIVWFGVRLGMGPLLDLEDALSRRSAEDLTPIRRAIPPEVRGVVGRLNSLFSEMSDTIRAKDTFISDAAHQLRNPMTGVLALSQAVATAKTKADIETRVADLSEAVSHAAKLTEDLLALERARSAPAAEHLPLVDVAEVLDDVSSRLEREAQATGVTLSLSIPASEVPVRIDRTLFEQAIENLLTNALTHGGEGISAIKIELSQQAAMAIVRVTDDGKGLSPDQFETALARFAQVSPAHGSGLGLPIAKAVAESAGGTLALASGNPGLSVRIDLPLARLPD